jgi:succinate-semialdehyde dehydrogenase/glutarate-semialdehyde dehydrogenase
MAAVQADAVTELQVASDRAVISITNPVNGEVVGRVPRHTAADVTDAVQRARSAQPDWAALPFRQRAQVIIQFHDLLLKHRESLFDVIQSEGGKSRRDAFVEMFAVACEARFYAYHGGKYLKPRRIQSAIPVRDRSQVRYHPVGVVGSSARISRLFCRGDAIPRSRRQRVVLKPASLTPLTALWPAISWWSRTARRSVPGGHRAGQRAGQLLVTRSIM